MPNGRLAKLASAGLLASAFAVGMSQPAAAAVWPGAVSSWYMDSVDPAVLFDMGCSLGTARAGGSKPQDALVILAYGQPQLRNGSYGTYAFQGRGFVTIAQIRAAVIEYAHGFWQCTGANLKAHVRIAVGTSNFANWSKDAGLTDAELTAFGKAWATLVNNLNNDITAKGYQRQADVVGAADIELGWGDYASSKRWADAYATVNSWPYYDFGDAAGCPPAGSCAPWTQDQVYNVAWGFSPAWAVPQIYLENGVQADQWQRVSKRGVTQGKTKIVFAGTLTQHGACLQGNPCNGTDNTAAEGWQQLWNKTTADPATAITNIRFSADIKFH